MIRRIFAFSLLILTPQAAFANVIIPSLAVTWPVMWLLLAAVIVIEVIVLKRIWPGIEIKSIMFSASFANLASTLVGVPVAWCIYYFGITVPGYWIISGGGYETISNLPKFISVPLAVIMQAPIIAFGGGLFNSYIGFLLLLPLTYFLSYWIEYIFFEFQGVNEAEILRGVRLANRASYLFVLILVTVCFVMIANHQDSRLGTFCNKVWDKSSWPTLLMPYK